MVQGCCSAAGREIRRIEVWGRRRRTLACRADRHDGRVRGDAGQTDRHDSRRRPVGHGAVRGRLDLELGPPPRPRRPDRPRDERRRASHPLRGATVRRRLRRRQRLGRGPLRERPRPDRSAHEQGRQEDHDRLQLVRRRLRRRERLGDERGRRDGAAHQSKEEPRRREGRDDSERRRLRVRLDLGRRSRTRRGPSASIRRPTA